jgi:hypothetical protein
MFFNWRRSADRRYQIFLNKFPSNCQNSRNILNFEMAQPEKTSLQAHAKCGISNIRFKLGFGAAG